MADDDQAERRERRVGIIHVHARDLERMLRLPEGLRVVSTRDDWARAGIRLMVEGDVLPVVPEASEPPDLLGMWVDQKGRLTWQADAAVSS